MNKDNRESKRGENRESGEKREINRERREGEREKNSGNDQSGKSRETDQRKPKRESDLRDTKRNDTKVRLNRLIADRSHYSRREADRLILEGRVSINRDKVENPAITLDADAPLFIDGKKLPPKNDNYTVIIYHKPKGELVTKRDPFSRKTVFDSLPSHFCHFISIGRLDFASEGLLILTDSAAVADRLTRSDLERIYNVKIDSFVTKELEKAMSEGLELGGSTAGAHPLSDDSVSSLAPFSKWRVEKDHPHYSRLKIALTEGKNREIRRFFGYFGVNVLDLKRVSFGEISLNALPIGKWRYLNKTEYRYLHDLMRG